MGPWFLISVTQTWIFLDGWSGPSGEGWGCGWFLWRRCPYWVSSSARESIGDASSVMATGRGRSVEAPGAHLLGHHAEHHAVRGHRAPAPVVLEVWMVLVEDPGGEGAALGRVGEELGAPADRDPLDVGAARAALGDDVEAGVAPEIADLLQVIHADERERRRVVEKPHGRDQRRAVRVDGAEDDDVLGGQVLLDPGVREGHGAIHTFMKVLLSYVVRP